MDDTDALHQAYRDLMQSPQGELVLKDLERQALSAPVDRKNVNPNNAIWRVAQHELVRYILAMCERPKQPITNINQRR